MQFMTGAIVTLLPLAMYGVLVWAVIYVIRLLQRLVRASERIATTLETASGDNVRAVLRAADSDSL